MEPAAKIDISHPTLFGNEAAEDENEEVFSSFWVYRNEQRVFQDPSRRIAVVKAYKGEGKSALLRATRRQLTKERATHVLVSTTGPVARPALENTDSTSWAKAWRLGLLELMAAELASNLGLSIELQGKGRDELPTCQALIAHLRREHVGRPIAGSATPEAALSQLLPQELQIWIFVDDIDRNYENTQVWKASVAGFFDAARDLVNNFRHVIIRASVRPNVWAAISSSFESLSHIRQYLQTMTWTESDALEFLKQRINGYLKRTDQLDVVRTFENQKAPALLGLVFETPVVWGGNSRPIHVPIFTLAKHRPRWMVELCKLAAAKSVRANKRLIYRTNLMEALPEFGRSRKVDLAAEFKSQCEQINELIDAFYGQPEEYSTAELLTLITNKILTHLSPKLTGNPNTPRNLELAALLFEVGFIYGRRNLEGGAYEHIAFQDSPDLFTSRTNLDAGLRWEVHPVYRQVLGMRDEETGQTRPRRQRR